MILNGPSHILTRVACLLSFLFEPKLSRKELEESYKQQQKVIEWLKKEGKWGTWGPTTRQESGDFEATKRKAMEEAKMRFKEQRLAVARLKGGGDDDLSLWKTTSSLHMINCD